MSFYVYEDGSDLIVIRITNNLEAAITKGA